MSKAEKMIGPEIRARVETELDAIEREHSVRILLAVESGSRAWGFPSRDSDYDVRFLYLQPVEHYLSIADRRDVIERPIDAVLDINGWDLRKALQLMMRSNAVLIEWLCSPVRYRAAGDLPERLLALACAGARLTSLAYHYDHQARRSFDTIREAEGPVRPKSYCYASRSALALSWIRSHGAAPPMDLSALMAGVSLPATVSSAILELVEAKRAATEGDVRPRIDVLDDFIAATLAVPVVRIDSVAETGFLAQADALFASLLLSEPRASNFEAAPPRSGTDTCS